MGHLGQRARTLFPHKLKILARFSRHKGVWAGMSWRRAIARNPMVAGAPMLGLCFGGLYFLTTFQQGRYERVDFYNKSQSQREYDLEAELDGVLRKMDLSDYTPVPIPGQDGASRERAE